MDWVVARAGASLSSGLAMARAWRWRAPRSSESGRGEVATLPSRVNISSLSGSTPRLNRDSRDHRHAEIGGKSLGIERQPVTFCHVDHVQGDDRGDALRDQFA